MKLKIYRTYGVMAHEYEPIFSENPAGEAADQIEVEIPEGFTVSSNGIVESDQLPFSYTLNQLLDNNGDQPCFRWVDYDGEHCVNLQIVESNKPDLRIWQCFETNDERLKDNLSRFLKENGIYYELSGCYDGWHFSIKVSTWETEKINAWLDGQKEEE